MNKKRIKWSEYNCIGIPMCEIRKWLLQHNISEEQYLEHSISQFDKDAMAKEIFSIEDDGTRKQHIITKEKWIDSCNKTVYRLYHPTNDELKREEEYINELKEDGVNIDFQSSLSERDSFKGLLEQSSI